MKPVAISPYVNIDQHNELQCLRIQNEAACATVFLQGAHITEYSPTNSRNILFVSKQETYSTDQAIRGGIPICWPWFGDHTNDDKAPAHGFVRTREWQYDIIRETPQRTDIRFSIETTGNDEGFPFTAKLELLMSIGETLIMSLTTKNTGDLSFPLSQAFHSYFNCDDIGKVTVTGLSGRQTVNKLTNSSLSFPKDFSFNQEIDWVVLDEGQPILFSGVDNTYLQLTRLGSRSVVVWNPWQEKSQKLSHFHPLDYKHMFCIETTNTADDSRLLKPKQGHSMVMEITQLADQ